MRALSAAVGMIVGGAIAGCVLVTGGTDGYSALQAAGCRTAQDCSGQVCCFGLGDAGTPSAVCQASCPASQQSCAVGSDCGDGGECLAQSCTFEGTTVQVTTCGAISFCTQ